MKQIRVLAPGAARCERLSATTQQAADDPGIQYELEKVTDIRRFPESGVMMTPAPMRARFAPSCFPVSAALFLGGLLQLARRSADTAGMTL